MSFDPISTTTTRSRARATAGTRGDGSSNHRCYLSDARQGRPGPFTKADERVPDRGRLGVAQEQLRMLAQAMEHVPDSVYITDMHNRILFVNDTFCQTYWYRRDEIVGRPCTILWAISSGSGGEERRFRKTSPTGWHNEFIDLRSDGARIPVSLAASVVRSDDGEAIAIVRITRDLSERKKLEENLRRLSRTDGLTALANRRCFDEALELEWRRAWRLGEPVSLIIFDVDFFKGYNDCLGHPAGDQCLKRIAEVARHSLRRATDLVARYGGEEFVVLLPGIGSVEAMKVAEKLRRQVHGARILHPGSQVDRYVTVSLGVATIHPGLGVQPADLVSRADRALYRAKREGRNRARDCALCPVPASVRASDDSASPSARPEHVLFPPVARHEACGAVAGG